MAQGGLVGHMYFSPGATDERRGWGLRAWGSMMSWSPGPSVGVYGVSNRCLPPHSNASPRPALGFDSIGYRSAFPGSWCVACGVGLRVGGGCSLPPSVHVMQ